MKNILVCQENLSKIGTELAQVNGTAYAHTYGAEDILGLALNAEAKAMPLVGNKKTLIGSRYVATSGRNLPKAHSYGRLVNQVILCRKARGWVLVDLTRESWGFRIPAPTLHLTRKAADKAIENFQGKFRVIQD